jgi:hypothetical protein
VTYLQLITSHLERNGASAELITAVEDYLEHAYPHQGIRLVKRMVDGREAGQS